MSNRYNIDSPTNRTLGVFPPDPWQPIIISRHNGLIRRWRRCGGAHRKETIVLQHTKWVIFCCDSQMIAVR